MSDYPTVAFNLGAGYIDDAKVNEVAEKVDELDKKVNEKITQLATETDEGFALINDKIDDNSKASNVRFASIEKDISDLGDAMEREVEALKAQVETLAQKALPTEEGESALDFLARIDLLDLIVDADGDQITDNTGDTYIAAVK